MQPIPDLFEENVERYPQYDDPFDDESNDEKTVYSEYIESLELKPEGNTDFKNVPKVLGIDTKAEEHQTNHIYLDYENFKRVARSSITNIDIDILLDSSANVLKDSIKFDDKLFCDAVFVPSRRGASNSGHMCGTKKRYRCVVDGCGRVIASKENLKYHYLSHCGIKPFKCYIANCKARFSARYSLDRHINGHTIHRGYKCPFCDYVVYEIAEMNEHVVIHPEINRK